MNIEAEFEKLRATVQQLKDRQDILDCIQRESRARDRQDVDQIAGCWWGDGVDEHGAIIINMPALWSKDDPSYERPIVAKPRSEGVRW